MTDIKTFELRMTRLIPATAEEVFDAYTDAEKQTVWFSLLSPEPGIVQIDVDLRVGGVQHAKWGPSADQLFWEDQTFLEIDRPHRLVTSSTGGTPDGDTMTTRIEITFDEVDGGTLMSVFQTGFPSEEMRDFFSTYAWVGALDRITAFFGGER
ncbi:MAG: SRPBCC domain-containing protein [Rhodoglobus sp.]